MLKTAWIPMAGGFYFFLYKFLKIKQKLFQICLTPKKYLISFNHSASNCMKSLLIICSKSAKVMTKQCSGAILISISLDKAFQSYSFGWLFIITPKLATRLNTWLKVNKNEKILIFLESYF